MSHHQTKRKNPRKGGGKSKNRGAQKANLLKQARSKAKRQGKPVPNSFAAIGKMNRYG